MSSKTARNEEASEELQRNCTRSQCNNIAGTKDLCVKHGGKSRCQHGNCIRTWRFPFCIGQIYFLRRSSTEPFHVVWRCSDAPQAKRTRQSAASVLLTVLHMTHARFYTQHMLKSQHKTCENLHIRHVKTCK